MTDIQKVKFKGMAIGTLCGIILSFAGMFIAVLIGSTKVAVAITEYKADIRAQFKDVNNHLSEHDKEISSLQNQKKQ